MKSNREIMVKLTVPEQVLKDILTTAVEGGSHYWLMADSIERDDDLNVTRITNPRDAETGTLFDSGMFKPSFNPDADITPQIIFNGLELLAQGALPGRPDLHAKLFDVPRGDADFDAADVDVILQLGYFGETIFG